MNRPKHGGNPSWAATVAGCPPSLILDFSASISPLGPPSTALAAIKLHIDNLTNYPNPDYPELCQAIAAHHQIPARWVLPGNGAAELLTWAGWEFSKLNTTLLPTPAFGDYWRSLQTFGTRIIPRSMMMDDGEIGDLDFALRHLPTEIPHSLGLIVNNPHNPTGQIWSKETILAYLSEFDLVLVDESFMDFLPPTEQQSLIPFVAQYSNLVILRSLTKFYSLPGLRLGYCIGHPDRLRRWKNWRDPWPVNSLAAAAAIAVLGDTEFERSTWDWLAEARSGLFDGLKQIAGLHPYPGAANFILVRSDRSVTELQTKLLEQHQILIRDCISFPELGDRFFRVAVRTLSENDRLLTALRSVN
ncbi:threonine-phosphate decarboxylase CobD [Chamaesiphon minutus]|uniref:threonine-phosphate decarboxylase n=1 Tax=Chamaesiphon minutus (strain ATCC 27169 / PCC 6605) TaxID=1173020 RepID=K9UPK1_CHAP6|nr:threonine-phosphate decarboxylase CobD [Chamaesiphon minutus]AFY96336.1 L-threonine-O-3-phosphate decarboxylase [Chamaesiphon minutus PCC 6605]